MNATLRRTAYILLMSLITWGCTDPVSEVISISERSIADKNFAAFCTLDKMSNLKMFVPETTLGSENLDIRTVDDENMIVLIESGQARIIRFTTFKKSLSKFGCTPA